MRKTNNTTSDSALQACCTCPLPSPTGTPFSLLLKHWHPLLVLCAGWKAGRGVKWRLNAFNPIRQNPLGLGAEDNIFPHQPQSPRGTAAAAQSEALGSVTVAFRAGKVLLDKDVRSGGPGVRLSLGRLTSPSAPSLVREDIVVCTSHNCCIVPKPDGTDDTDPAAPAAFVCINTEATDFPRAAPYCCPSIICPPKLLLN